MFNSKGQLLAHRPGELRLKTFKRDSDKHCVKNLHRRGVQQISKPLNTGDNARGIIKRKGAPPQEGYKPQQNGQVHWEILHPKVRSKKNELT